MDEMCYGGTLVMPSDYAVMNEDEMTYVEGGWNYTYSKKNIAVPMQKKYLSRTVCLAFADYVVRKNGNGFFVNGMGRIRVAKELFAHAVGYYAASVLKKAGLKAAVIDDIRSCGSVADIGLGDGLDIAYEIVWSFGGI